MKKRKLAISILISIFLIVVLYFLSVFLFSVCKTVATDWKKFNEVMTYMTTIETAENIKSTNEVPDWLSYIPASATNISYWRMPWTATIFEYEVNENDFLQWAKENEIPLTDISAATNVFRYLPPPDTDDRDEISEYLSERITVVYEGYEYFWEDENSGGCTHIVYDSKNQKAYHDYSQR